MDKNLVVGLGIGTGIAILVMFVVDHSSLLGASGSASQSPVLYAPVPAESQSQRPIENSIAQRSLWDNDSAPVTPAQPAYALPTQPEAIYQTSPSTENSQIDDQAAPVATFQSDNPAANATVNPQTGQYYPSVPGGSVNPQTGAFYPGIQGGTVDPQTGTYSPGTGG